MSNSKPNVSPLLDRIAIVLSGLCLLHCLALPIALLLAPFFADWLAATETQLHWILLGLAAPVSAFAWWRGYAVHHNAFTVAIGLVGLSLMLVGVSHLAGAGAEIALTVVGVTLVLIAHVPNVLFRHRH